MTQGARVNLQGLGRAVHGFTTTRQRGMSAKPFDSFNLGDHVGDDVVHVQTNRQRLNQWVPSSPIWVEQVHGTRVLDAQSLVGQPIQQADGLVTSRAGQVLGILTADCMPVILASDTSQVLGLAHAGWRGLVDGVLGNTVAAMRKRQPELGRWRAWIGPCIGPQAFEVGDDVRDAFLASNPAFAGCFTKHVAPHKWHCDLPSIAKVQLLELGAESVTWCGFCTATDPAQRFYSYRRDGQTGRMATVAWLV